MFLIADVFPRILAPKNIVKAMFSKSFFRGLLERQHNKWTETLQESEGQHLYNIN